jgi:hypothetical protein
MAMPLPRILSAVPQVLRVRLEIAKAIQTLTARDDETQRSPYQRGGAASEADEYERLKKETIREILCDKAGFRRDQPRWLKGSGRISGRWSGGGGLLAAEASYRRIRGGHHYVPKQLYDTLFRKQLLSRETRDVFHNAVTGPLPPGIHKNDLPHRIYTKAVTQLWKTFLERYKITSQQMTPTQAHEFLALVRHSNDPRIRDYNARFR